MSAWDDFWEDVGEKVEEGAEALSDFGGDVVETVCTVGGTVVGTTFGFTVGGPVGAIAGGAFGYTAGSAIGNFGDDNFATITGTVAGASTGMLFGPFGGLVGGVIGYNIGSGVDEERAADGENPNLFIGWTDNLTGRAGQDELLANPQLLEQLIENLEEFKDVYVENAKAAVQTEFTNINNVQGVSEYVGQLNVGMYDEYFDEIKDTTTRLIQEITSRMEDIEEYANSSFWQRVGGTAATAGGSIISGGLDVLEGFGDGIVAFGAWAIGGLTGSDSIRNSAADLIDNDYSGAVENWVYDNWGNYSVFTQDSLIGSGLRVVGRVTNPLSWQPSTAAISGFGNQMENNLLDGMSFTEAFNNSISAGVAQGLAPFLGAAGVLGSAVYNEYRDSGNRNYFTADDDLEYKPATGPGDDAKDGEPGPTGDNTDDGDNGSSSDGGSNPGGGGNGDTTQSTDPPTEAVTEAPQTEPVTEAKTDPPTNPQTDPKTEPKTQPKTEPKTNPQTNPQTQPQTQPQPQPRPSGGGGGRSFYPSGDGEGNTTPVTEAPTESPLDDLVDDIKKGNKYSKIPTSSKPLPQATTTTKSGNGVIPVLAGLSAAAAAGIGAKAYLDRKNNRDNDDDEEINTEDWSTDSDVDIEYQEPVEKKEETLDFDDTYDDFELEEPEKYDAKTHQELEDLQ